MKVDFSSLVVDIPVMGAEAASYGFTVQNTLEILPMQYIDKVIDVCCAGPANSSGSVVEETAELPQLQLVEL